MPIYTYSCPACGERREERVPLREEEQGVVLCNNPDCLANRGACSMFRVYEKGASVVMK